MQNKNKIALLIDADNTDPSKVAPIIAHYHEPAVRRAYGNWCKPSLKNWEAALRQHGIRAVQQFDCATGKNAADIALTVDAMDLLHSGLYDTFVIVASDSDYTPLVTKLRESGAEVIGIGQPNTPEAYRSACSDFILVEDMMADISKEFSGLIDDFFIPNELSADEDPQPKSEDDFWDNLEDFETEPVSFDDSLWSGLLKEESEAPADAAISTEVDSIMDELFGDCENKAPEDGDITWGDLDTLLAKAPDEESTDESDEIVWDTLDMGCNIISSDDPAMRSLHKLLQVAYDYCKNEDGYAPLSATGNFIRALRPDFDYRDYGFKQLHELLEAFPEKYRLISYPNRQRKILAFCCCA